MAADLTLKQICKISDGTDMNRFVGVRLSNGIPEVCFPIGFSLSSSESDIKDDICLLIKILKKYNYREETAPKRSFQNNLLTQFPLLSYQRIVLRYLNYGDYCEHENIFTSNKSGKIIWSKTIKKEKPVFTSNGPVYTDFIVKKSQLFSDKLFLEIYKYCVYCAFQYIGWLYTKKTVSKPKIPFNKKLFITAVQDKLSRTNVDTEKELFHDMIAVINSFSDEGFKHQNFIFGTYSFEYVWEKIIDQAFGIRDKSKYFPRSFWNVPQKIENHVLEPDTILVKENDIFVLDAKYYRFGQTGNPRHLPDTSSIHKQITYGEYLDVCEKFNFDHIYNAFIMPANLFSGPFACNRCLKYIGFAESDWKNGSKTYEKVAGILVDTKYLMYNCLKTHDLTDNLCKTIQNVFV